MVKFNIPKRVYIDGKKKRMVSMRLPEPLIEALEKASKDKGMTSTELVSMVLDQFLQWNDKQKE